jgi:hypothetical protein
MNGSYWRTGAAHPGMYGRGIVPKNEYGNQPCLNIPHNFAIASNFRGVYETEKLYKLMKSC